MTEEFVETKAQKKEEPPRLIFEGQVRNRQQYFGGLPLSLQAPSIVFERSHLKVAIGQEKKPKVFNSKEFLDLYLQEKEKRIDAPVDEDKAMQTEIKNVLNIRTFDEL